MADAFDPKAYLASKTAAPAQVTAFDPKAYLAAKVTVSAPDQASALDKIIQYAPYPVSLAGEAGKKIKDYFANNKGKETSAGDEAMSTAQNYLNMATWGHGPQALAGTEKAFDYLMPNSQDADKSYVEKRDYWINKLKKANEENPKSGDMGKIAGILANITATPKIPGVDKIPAGTSYLGKIASSAIKNAIPAAAYTSAMNPGDTAGVVEPVQAEARLENAKKGLEFGGAFGAGLSALAESPLLAKALSEKANVAAVAALRGQKRDYIKKLYSPQIIQDTGDAILDKNVIGWIPKGSQGLADKAESELAKTGTNFQSSLDKLDEAIANKTGQNMPTLPGSAPVDVPRVGVDRDTVAKYLKDKLLSKTGVAGSRGRDAQVNAFVDELWAGDRYASPGMAQQMKNEINPYSGYGKNPLDRTMEQHLNNTLGGALSQGILDSGDAAVNYLGTDLPQDWVEKFKGIKKDYGSLARTSDIAGNRAAGDSAARMASMSDMQSAQIGALIAAAKGAHLPATIATEIIAGGANNAVRKYGMQPVAKILYEASKGFNSAPMNVLSNAGQYLQGLTKAASTAAPASAWNYFNTDQKK